MLPLAHARCHHLFRRLVLVGFVERLAQRFFDALTQRLCCFGLLLGDFLLVFFAHINVNQGLNLWVVGGGQMRHQTPHKPSGHALLPIGEICCLQAFMYEKQ